MLKARSRAHTLPAHKIMAQWIHDSWDFDFFVTLTANSDLSPNTMRKRLKAWDARMNRALYGPKWAVHRDDLIWFFGFLEKPKANPHWHLLATLRDQATSLSDLLSAAICFGRAIVILWVKQNDT